MPTSQWFIHHLLCSFVHSHPITHLNYWNKCRLGCAIMLAATLLAPTRYESISKHHAASNVNITTSIKEIVKYWGNWESRRKISKYRSNSWWRHQMETFPALLAFCVGNSPVTGEFSGIPHTNASDAEHWCFLWSLRRHSTHYAGILRRCTDSFVASPSAAVVLTILGESGKKYDILKTISNQSSP